MPLRRPTQCEGTRRVLIRQALRRGGQSRTLPRRNARWPISPDLVLGTNHRWRYGPLETLTAPVLLRSSCGSCGRSIGLAPPRPTTTARIWTCNGCASVFFGAENEDVTDGLSPLQDAGRIAVDALIEGGESVRAQLVSQSQRLVEGLVADAYRGEERRSHTRYPVAAPVTGIPLSADFRVVGPALAMMTLNISLGGAALIHKKTFDAPYLALDFADAGLGVLQILLRVLRTSDIGLQHVTAGDFLGHAKSE